MGVTPSPASEVNPARNELLPAIFHLGDFRHVGHGAAGVEIRQDRHLPGAAQDVGAFRHEMHAAEDDVFASGMRGLLRKFVGVAAKIGEANDFIALIVMSKNHALAAQSLAGGGDAVVHGVIGQDEVIFQTANCCCGCHCHVSPSAPDANAIAAIPQ